MSLFTCTPETPWSRGLPTPVAHPAAHEIRDQRWGHSGGDIREMRCPVCGTEWDEELAQ